MDCAFDYCICSKKFECMLDGVNINSVGMCDDCIIIDLSKIDIEALKKQQRQELNERWKESNRQQ